MHGKNDKEVVVYKRWSEDYLRLAKGYQFEEPNDEKLELIMDKNKQKAQKKKRVEMAVKEMSATVKQNEQKSEVKTKLR